MVNREYVQLAAYYLKIVVCMKSLKWKRACHGYLEETKVRYSFFFKKKKTITIGKIYAFFFFFFFFLISAVSLSNQCQKNKKTRLKVNKNLGYRELMSAKN